MSYHSGKALESIFKKPDSLFMKIKVKDLLFNGFEIDCAVKDFAGSTICNEIKQNYEDFGLTLVESNKYKFSLWSSVSTQRIFFLHLNRQKYFIFFRKMVPIQKQEHG